jgi:polyisoprenoid-binding protein YceI
MKTLFLFACLLSSSLWAETWVMNKDHSEILFKVPYLSVSELTGRFNEFTASVDVKAEELKDIKISIVAASIDTGHKMRDNHLRANDFLGSSQNPNITYVSQSVSKSGKGSYRTTGDLTIKEIKKTVTMDFSVTDSVKDTWGYENKFVKFTSKLKRQDFNINWNKTLEDNKYLVGDEITFWGVFQIQPPSDKTPMSKHMIPDTQQIRAREIENRKKEESGFSKKLRGLINGQ